jgi:hypothetical protein
MKQESPFTGFALKARVSILEGSEPSNQELIKLAQTGGCFDFLANEPDIYTCEDGEPV